MRGIDLHTHLAPVFGADQQIAGTAPSSDGVLVIDGHRVGPAGLYQPLALLAHLDTAGLEQAVVSVPPPFYRQHLDETQARVWVRALNDGLEAAVADSPRLRPLAYLPLEHPAIAVAEYRRVREMSFAGVTASAGGASVPLSAPELKPLWQLLDSDAATLLLHPGTTADSRLAPFYLSNLLGNPAETAVAVAHLIMGDVVATHPRIRIVLVHCGGTVPAIVGRWQRGVDSARPGVPVLTEQPVQAVRRFYVDCLAHDPAVVDLAVTTFGANRLVLGSDWPFPMGTDDPATLVTHLGEQFVRRIAVDNARAALGLVPDPS